MSLANCLKAQVHIAGQENFPDFLDVWNERVASTGGAIMLFVAAFVGIPVSTTHTITGSIIGVGAARRVSAVRWNVASNHRGCVGGHAADRGPDGRLVLQAVRAHPMNAALPYRRAPTAS
jgi:hypothetical protein